MHPVIANRPSGKNWQPPVQVPPVRQAASAVSQGSFDTAK